MTHTLCSLYSQISQEIDLIPDTTVRSHKHKNPPCYDQLSQHITQKDILYCRWLISWPVHAEGG